MVPTDYRLDKVCTKLVERLEGIRRSFAGDPDRAAAEFRRLARQHVEAAIREYRGVAMPDHPRVQASLLRREVLQTFLPRYTRLATEMNQAEEENFGFGAWAEPQGKVILAVLAVLALLTCGRLIRVPELWPLDLSVLVLPFLSDFAAWMYQGRYRRRIEALLDDLARVQDLSHPYLGKDELIADESDNVVHLLPLRSEDDDDE